MEKNIICWGRNDHGQSTPRSGDFIQIESANNANCALDSDGLTVCWGNWMTYWQNGASSTDTIFVQIEMSNHSSACGMKEDLGHYSRFQFEIHLYHNLKHNLKN